MLLNFIQDVLLVIFIVCSTYTLWQDRRNAYGIIVLDGNKPVTNGKQGIQFSFGRLKSNDIVLNDPTVSRIQACFTYNGKIIQKEAFCRNACEGDNYKLAGHSFSFEKAEKLYVIDLKYLPLIASLVFTFFRFISLNGDYRNAKLIIPFIILAAYQVISVLFSVNSAAVTELSFSIFLSYYGFAMLYKSSAEGLAGAINKCILGVMLYTSMALLVKLLLTYINVSVELGMKQLDKIKYLNGKFITLHDALRFVSVIGIIVFILINIMFAKEEHGARNWVYIGSVSVQPSELVKVLLLFVVVLPVNKRFKDVSSILYMLVIPAVCFLYCLIIKDSGALLEMAAIWAVAIVLQSANILIAGLLVSGMFLGEKILLAISSTALSRYLGWSAENLWDSLASQGAFNTADQYGYQIVNSLVATVKNGGAFGMRYDDVNIMRSIAASDSDLVMAAVGEKYGFVMLFLLLFIFALIIVSAIFNLKKQTKLQQLLSLLSLILLVVAVTLNVLGTFGIVPLTGVVLPAVSAGVSSSISYGIVFGIISAFSKNAFTIFKESDKVYEKTDFSFLKNLCNLKNMLKKPNNSVR